MRTILEEAQGLVFADRRDDYGDATHSCQTIADLMTAYLHGRGLLPADRRLEAYDAPQLLLLLKVSRFATGGAKRDTLVDQAGYAEVTAKVVGIDPEQLQPEHRDEPAFSEYVGGPPDPEGDVKADIERAKDAEAEHFDVGGEG